jgi:hypothetical protein
VFYFSSCLCKLLFIVFFSRNSWAVIRWNVNQSINQLNFGYTFNYCVKIKKLMHLKFTSLSFWWANVVKCYVLSIQNVTALLLNCWKATHLNDNGLFFYKVNDWPLITIVSMSMSLSGVHVHARRPCPYVCPCLCLSLRQFRSFRSFSELRMVMKINWIYI